MQIRRVIRREIAERREGVDVAGGINAVVAININEPDTTASVSSRQRIVQRSHRRAAANPPPERPDPEES